MSNSDSNVGGVGSGRRTLYFNLNAKKYVPTLDELNKQLGPLYEMQRVELEHYTLVTGRRPLRVVK